jgi:hypothetical protein
MNMLARRNASACRQDKQDKNKKLKGEDRSESVRMKAKASENAGVHGGFLCLMPVLSGKLRRGSDSDRQARDRGIPSE